MEGSFFCVRCSPACILTVPERTELSVWTKYSASSEVIRNWKENTMIYSICYSSFCFSLPKIWKKVFQLHFLSFSLTVHGFICIIVSIWRPQGFTFSFRPQLAAWNTPSLSLINLTLSFLTSKSHYWQKWNTSQIWSQELCIVSLTNILSV